MEGTGKGRKKRRLFSKTGRWRKLDAEVFIKHPQTNVLYFWHKILLHYRIGIFY